MEASERRGLLATWAVEHFTHWWLGPEDTRLASDLLYSLDGSQWRMGLRRTGASTLHVELHSDCPTGPESLDVAFQFHLVGDVDVPLQEEPTQATFGRDSRESFEVDAESAIFGRRGELLPGDTLTLRLGLWRQWRRNAVAPPTGCAVGRRVPVTSNTHTMSFNVFPDRKKAAKAQSPLTRAAAREESDNTLTIGCDKFRDDEAADLNADLGARIEHHLSTTTAARVRLRLMDADFHVAAPSTQMFHLFTEMSESHSMPGPFVSRRFLEEHGSRFVRDGVVNTRLEWRVARPIDAKIRLGTTLHYARPDREMGTSLASDLRAFLLAGWEFDLTLASGDAGEVRAHRVLVCARSPVFAAMMERDMAERRSGRVQIDDMDGTTLTAFVTFLYIGDLDWSVLNCDTLAQLYAAGDKYDVLSLKKRCGAIIRKRVTPDNALDILAFADLHSDARMRDNAVDVVRRRTKEALATDEGRKGHRRTASASSSA